MIKNEREHGYYWVKTKRTKVWMIAQWWPSLNKGKGFWDTMQTIENDTRGGFCEVDERQIKRIVEPIKRVRKNVKKIENTKFSEPQKHRIRVRQRC